MEKGLDSGYTPTSYHIFHGGNSALLPRIQLLNFLNLLYNLRTVPQQSATTLNHLPQKSVDKNRGEKKLNIP